MEIFANDFRIRPYMNTLSLWSERFLGEPLPKKSNGSSVPMRYVTVEAIDKIVNGIKVEVKKRNQFYMMGNLDRAIEVQNIFASDELTQSV